MTDRDPNCVFCAIAAGEKSAAIVYEDDRVIAFLDARPLFPGHLLVVPVRHVETLGELSDDLALPLLRVVRAAARAMESALGAQGSLVANNNVVSQSVPHLHVHVIPRTKGDGLRGFFWPRVDYPDDETRDATAAALSVDIARELSGG